MSGAFPIRSGCPAQVAGGMMSRRRQKASASSNGSASLLAPLSERKQNSVSSSAPAVVSAAYPYDLNYGEGFVLNDALRMVRGEPVWTDLTTFPMVRSPYPPLYLLATGLLSVANPSLLPARLISLSSAFVIAGLLVWHAHAKTRSLVPAALAGGLWLGSTFVYQWAPLARVDLMGLALTLAAVLLLLAGGPALLSATAAEENTVRLTVAGDKLHDQAPFVDACRIRNITPHVAQKAKGSAVDRRTTRHLGYAVSQQVRKRGEEIFGWQQTVGGLRKLRYRGIRQAGLRVTLAAPAFNLVRMAKLEQPGIAP